MVPSLADRLSIARHQFFVGRSDEMGIFRSVISAAQPAFQILYIYGPSGIGKSTLMAEAARACAEAGLPAHLIDARNFDPSPDSFLLAVRLALGLGADSVVSPFQALAADSHRHVLLVDALENLSPLDNWLREVFLPQLPEDTLVVLAGRNAPSEAWHADPGWQTLIRVLPLRNLAPDESREYLIRRSIPPEQHGRILEFTHGHALALSLVADTFAQRPDWQFDPESSPDIVKTLLERFVQKVPSPAHRAVLDICALVRVTTEGLLAQMLAQPAAADAAAAHELFEWLRSLSFIESGREGIFPHDMARETLASDLRWRNPDWYRELHNRARAYYSSRFKGIGGVEQVRILYDYVFLHRENPVIRTMLEWQSGSTTTPDRMNQADVPALVEMVARHEGDDSAAVAQAWLSSTPEGTTVYRDEKGKAAGFITMLELTRAPSEQLQADPATRRALEFLQQQVPLRTGELATHYRFWMARDTYQDVSPIQTLIFLNTVRYQLTTPGLVYHFLPCANPDMWAGAFAYANLVRRPELDYQFGGKSFGVYTHDWRAEPPLMWLSMLAEREVGGRDVAPPAPAPPLLVLSQSEFIEAVQEALRSYTRLDELRSNPLIRSRLVLDRVGTSASDSERAIALQSLLLEAAERLRIAGPRDLKLYRALYHTYIKPEATQERAAEVLDLPFSTYRRHLKAGIQRVVVSVWGHEIGGG